MKFCIVIISYREEILDFFSRSRDKTSVLADEVAGGKIVSYKWEPQLFFLCVFKSKSEISHLTLLHEYAKCIIQCILYRRTMCQIGKYYNPFIEQHPDRILRQVVYTIHTSYELRPQTIDHGISCSRRRR